MRRNAQALALLVLLLVTGAATLYVTYGRATPTVQMPTPASPAEPWYSYLLDVADWYEVTPNESAVASAIDLTIDGLKALPENVGRWEGQPYDFGGAVAEWSENSDLALSNLYRDEQGHAFWLSLFGSRGRKSYYLFEHTPITSYPCGRLDPRRERRDADHDRGTLDPCPKGGADQGHGTANRLVLVPLVPIRSRPGSGCHRHSHAYPGHHL